jgi:alpha-mannosidase
MPKDKQKNNKETKTNPDDSRPIVHLVCQAHIDPVWMWTWQEGAREGISTFHTAANLLEEFPEFIFNHNESVLYEWIEDNDLELFKHIRKLVKQGRWNISGGWYLQPDLNMPAGETVVQVIQEGRRYFREKFGAAPKVAYNFDTFGHPASLPQILAHAGYEMYIHCRPVASQLNLPAALYQWQGHDGTRVLALRPDTGWYCTGAVDKPVSYVRTSVEQAMQGVKQARETGRDTLVLWGLGDHGGGPTRADLLELRTLMTETTDVLVQHSTPEAYLERIKEQLPSESIPVHADELQRTFAGCYTSVAPVKRGMRRAEAMLGAAEKWSAIAWWRAGLPYPEKHLRRAWKAALFNTFHDTMCGSLAETALPGVLDYFGYATHMAEQLIFKAQNALLPATPPEPGNVPLYVFNPHPYPLKVAMGGHYLIDYRPALGRHPFALFDDAGNPVACQTGGGAFEQTSGGGQPHIQFIAEMPPMSVRRYEVRPNTKPVKRSTRPATLEVRQTAKQIVVENRWLRATFQHETASLTSLVDKVASRELLRAPLHLTAMRDTGDAWGGESNSDFNTPVGEFAPLTPEQVGEQWAGEDGTTGAALRVLPSSSELVPEGMTRDLACTVECLSGWRQSKASIQVTLYADLPQIDITTRLLWQERRKMAKLVLPFNLPQPRVTCEVPYGIAERAADGSEQAQNRWVRLDETDQPKSARPSARKARARQLSIGVANNGQYGFAVTPDGTLGLSLTRSAVHTRGGDLPIEPNEHHTFMDQGQIDTNFRVLVGTAKDITEALVPAAAELNQPVEMFAVFYPATPHLDPQEATQPFLQISPATVQLGALRKAHGEDALIVRVVESAGQLTTMTLSMEGAGSDFTLDMSPFEIVTLKIARSGKRVTIEQCEMLEG